MHGAPQRGHLQAPLKLQPAVSGPAGWPWEAEGRCCSPAGPDAVGRAAASTAPRVPLPTEAPRPQASVQLGDRLLLTRGTGRSGGPPYTIGLRTGVPKLCLPEAPTPCHWPGSCHLQLPLPWRTPVLRDPCLSRGSTAATVSDLNQGDHGGILRPELHSEAVQEVLGAPFLTGWVEGPPPLPEAWPIPRPLPPAVQAHEANACPFRQCEPFILVSSCGTRGRQGTVSHTEHHSKAQR